MFFLIICIVTYLWDALQWLPLAFIPLCIPLPACARLICVTNRMWQIDGMLFAKVFYERYCGFPLGLSLFCITHLGRSQLSCSIALWWNPSDKYLSLPASDHRIELSWNQILQPLSVSPMTAVLVDNVTKTLLNTQIQGQLSKPLLDSRSQNLHKIINIHCFKLLNIRIILHSNRKLIKSVWLSWMFIELYW